MQEQKEITEILRKFLKNQVDSDLIKRSENMLWYLEHSQPDSSPFSINQQQNKNQHEVNSDIECQVASRSVQIQKLSHSQELGRLGNWPTGRAETFVTNAQFGVRKDSIADSRSDFNSGINFGMWPKPNTTFLAEVDNISFPNHFNTQPNVSSLPNSFWTNSATDYPTGDRRSNLLKHGWGHTPQQQSVSGEGWWFEKPTSTPNTQSLASTQPGQTASWGKWDASATLNFTNTNKTATAFGQFNPTHESNSTKGSEIDQQRLLVLDDQQLRWIDDVPSTKVLQSKTEQSHSRWIDGLENYGRVVDNHDDYEMNEE